MACFRSKMAVANYPQLLAVLSLAALTLAEPSPALMPFVESTFSDKNSSLTLFGRDFSLAGLSERQLQCAVPGQSESTEHSFDQLGTNHSQSSVQAGWAAVPQLLIA